MTGMRVCLTIQEKLWIIKQRDDNQNIKQTKIAVDFQAKLNRPITRRNCIVNYGKGHFGWANDRPKVNLKMIFNLLSKFPRRNPRNPSSNER